MREMIGQMLATAAVLNIAEAVNLGREEGFADIADQIGAYQWSAILDDRTCFIAGTKILTNHGKVNIEQIRVGDFVMTRLGYQRVQETTQKEYTGQLCRLKTLRHEICCTLDHPIWIQGKGWVKAQDVRLNDHVFNSRNNILFGKILRIYEGFWNAHYRDTVRVQKCVFPLVLNPILVPVSAVNFNSNSFTGNIKIDRFSANLAFLYKSNFTFLKQGLDFCFNRSFSFKSAATGEGTEPPFMLGTRHYSKGYPAMQAFYSERWSTAQLRAEYPMFSFGAIRKYLSTTMAFNPGHLLAFAFHAAKVKSIDIRFKYLKKFITTRAYFLNMIAGISTNHATVFFRPAWARIQKFFTGMTGFPNPCFLAKMIATTRAIASTAYYAVKNFMTIMADTLMLRSHSIRDIIRYPVQQVNVYNLKVASDPVYFANGLLVHNCNICEGLDGTYFEPGDPALAELKPPIHPNCRCILVAVLKEELVNFPVKYSFFDDEQVGKFLINKV